jgi:hypothetical protein
MSVETKLRDQLRVLAEIPAPVDFADEALRNVRRRRRNRVLYAAGVVVVIAAAVVAAALVPSRSTRPGTPPPDTRLSVVGAYVAMVGGNSDQSTYWVLNPKTGRYQQVTQAGGRSIGAFLLSPNGKNALVYSEDVAPQWGVISTDALLRGTSKAVTWLPREPTSDSRGDPLLPAVGAQWSHDGSKILLPTAGDDRNGFRIYDTATHRLGTLVRVTLRPHERVMTWGRSNAEVAVTPGRNGKPASIRYLSANDGHQVGAAIAPHGVDETIVGYRLVQPISDGGGYLIGEDSAAVTNLSTGRTTTPTGLDTEQSVAWYNATHYIAAYPWYRNWRIALVDVTGRVVRTVNLPLGTKLMPDPDTARVVLEPQMAMASAYTQGGIRF